MIVSSLRPGRLLGLCDKRPEETETKHRGASQESKPDLFARNESPTGTNSESSSSESSFSEGSSAEVSQPQGAGSEVSVTVTHSLRKFGGIGSVPSKRLLGLVLAASFIAFSQTRQFSHCYAKGVSILKRGLLWIQNNKPLLTKSGATLLALSIPGFVGVKGKGLIWKQTPDVRNKKEARERPTEERPTQKGKAPSPTQRSFTHTPAAHQVPAQQQNSVRLAKEFDTRLEAITKSCNALGCVPVLCSSSGVLRGMVSLAQFTNVLAITYFTRGVRNATEVAELKSLRKKISCEALKNLGRAAFEVQGLYQVTIFTRLGSYLISGKQQRVFNKSLIQTLVSIVEAEKDVAKSGLAAAENLTDLISYLPATPKTVFKLMNLLVGTLSFMGLFKLVSLGQLSHIKDGILSNGLNMRMNIAYLQLIIGVFEYLNPILTRYIPYLSLPHLSPGVPYAAEKAEVKTSGKVFGQEKKTSSAPKSEKQVSTPVTPPKGGSHSLLRNRIMWRGALNLTRSMVESGGLDCCACNCGKVSSKIFNMCQLSTSAKSALNYGFMAWDAGKVTHWGLKKAFKTASEIKREHPPQKIANQVRNGVRKTVQQAVWAILMESQKVLETVFGG